MRSNDTRTDTKVLRGQSSSVIPANPKLVTSVCSLMESGLVGGADKALVAICVNAPETDIHTRQAVHIVVPERKRKRLSLVYGVLHLSLKAGVYALPTSACQRTVRTPEERVLFDESCGGSSWEERRRSGGRMQILSC